MNTERSPEAGFTMIEVMVAVLVTAIAALGFIAMYMTQTQAGAFTRHSTEASMLATDKLEALRSHPTPASSDDTVDAQGNSGGTFTRKWTIAQDTTNGFTTIMVQVGWDEDETTASCSLDTDCTRSRFCMPSGSCAGRAVIVRGSREN